MEVIYWISSFLIIFGMVGYPLSLLILDKIYINRHNTKDYTYVPTVTLLVVAHNEEKVIRKKLENILQLVVD